MARGPSPDSRRSGIRRRTRVRADLTVVVAHRDGSKQAARVIDVSVGGMHLRAERTPEYGENVTVVVRFREMDDWRFLPATVRWFTKQGFGVAFDDLDAEQARALRALVDRDVA